MGRLKEAFAYLRVSSVGQAKADRDGYRRQLETIRGFAKGRYKIVDVFQDAHTGTEEDRPAFSAMMAAARGNGVRTILIESMDRLARSLTVQIGLLSALESAGCTLWSASTAQNVTEDVKDDPMKEAMILMAGVFAQTEKKLLTRKLRRARDARSEEAGKRIEGRKPYGSREGEAEGLKIVRRLHRKNPRTGKRRSYAQIAEELNRRGVPSRSGKAWTRGMVWRVVQPKT